MADTIRKLPVDGLSKAVQAVDVDSLVAGIFDANSVASEMKNHSVTVFASEARSADEDSADFINENGRGLHLVIDVTADPGDDQFVFTIQGKDEVSGEYYDILESAAINALGTTRLTVYPGMTAVANDTENDILPRTWRVKAVFTDITPPSVSGLTFSVGASVIQ